MTCEEVTPFVDAYVDQELDEQDAAEMEAHLAQCDDCRSRVSAQVRFKEEFKNLLAEDRAPDALRARIVAGLDDLHVEAASDISQEIAAVLPVAAQRRRWQPAWVLLPLAAAAALVLVLPNFTVAPASSDPIPVIEQTVDWHRGGYPIEVTGPESVQVSQWFQGKVDFPVRPPAFGDMPVNLLGGRLANVRDRRAAYLLYEYQGTPVSVMVFDGAGLSVPSDKVQRIGGRDIAAWNQSGYEVAVMRDSGVTYTFTSALPQSEFLSVVQASVSR